MSLIEKSCVPCRGGIPALTPDEAGTLISQTPEWSLNDAATKIERRFGFGNFADALDFANQVGALAEDEGHHPDIAVGWGYCEVAFYTHKIKGLHENDFIMAAKVDALR
jgi:4a-hydroxytetrahydrobiopterin dehydratase